MPTDARTLSKTFLTGGPASSFRGSRFSSDLEKIAGLSGNALQMLDNAATSLQSNKDVSSNPLVLMACADVAE